MVKRRWVLILSKEDDGKAAKTTKPCKAAIKVKKTLMIRCLGANGFNIVQFYSLMDFFVRSCMCLKTRHHTPLFPSFNLLSRLFKNRLLSFILKTKQNVETIKRERSNKMKADCKIYFKTIRKKTNKDLYWTYCKFVVFVMQIVSHTRCFSINNTTYS